MSLCQFSPARRTPIGLPFSVRFDTTTISGASGTLQRSPKMLNSISPKRRVKATCCGWRDILVAEKDDAMLVIRTLDRGEGRIVERLGQIDAANLGAEGGAGGDYFNRH